MKTAVHNVICPHCRGNFVVECMDVEKTVLGVYQLPQKESYLHCMECGLDFPLESAKVEPCERDSIEPNGTSESTGVYEIHSEEQKCSVIRDGICSLKINTGKRLSDDQIRAVFLAVYGMVKSGKSFECIRTDGTEKEVEDMIAQIEKLTCELKEERKKNEDVLTFLKVQKNIAKEKCEKWAEKSEDDVCGYNNADMFDNIAGAYNAVILFMQNGETK